LIVLVTPIETGQAINPAETFSVETKYEVRRKEEISNPYCSFTNH
jgi:hypothetical protein